MRPLCKRIRAGEKEEVQYEKRLRLQCGTSPEPFAGLRFPEEAGGCERGAVTGHIFRARHREGHHDRTLLHVLHHDEEAEGLHGFLDDLGDRASQAAR